MPDGSLPVVKDAETKLIRPPEVGGVKLMSYGFVAKGASKVSVCLPCVYVLIINNYLSYPSSAPRSVCFAGATDFPGYMVISPSPSSIFQLFVLSKLDPSK